MIPWELLKDLAQISGLILAWAIYIGNGVFGIFLAVTLVSWVVDFCRKELNK